MVTDPGKTLQPTREYWRATNTTSRNIRSLDRVEEDKAKRGLVAVQALEGLQLRTSPSSSRSEGLIQVSMKASGHGDGDGDGDGDGSLLYGEMICSSEGRCNRHRWLSSQRS